MYNYFKIFILSLLVLLILFIIYMIMDIPSPKIALKIEPIQVKPIQIEPIKIASLEKSINNNIKKKPLALLPIDILSKLQVASIQSKEAMRPLKEAPIIKKKLSLKVPIKKNKKAIKNKIITKKKTKTKKKSISQKTLITFRKKHLPKKKKPKNKKKYTLQKQKVIKKVYQEKNILAKSYYFEPLREEKIVENNAPLKFVQTLGMVSVSTDYETEFTIPQKEEWAKEGIVNISNATIETNEIEDLNFVNTLGIVEISQDFETINADTYLN